MDWLEKAIHGTKAHLAKAQARYKRNYDARLRRENTVIKSDDWVYIRVERRDAKEHRHKLSAVAEDPYRVDNANGNTVVIESQTRR